MSSPTTFVSRRKLVCFIKKTSDFSKLSKTWEIQASQIEESANQQKDFTTQTTGFNDSTNNNGRQLLTLQKDMLDKSLDHAKKNKVKQLCIPGYQVWLTFRLGPLLFWKPDSPKSVRTQGLSSTNQNANMSGGWSWRFTRKVLGSMIGTVPAIVIYIYYTYIYIITYIRLYNYIYTHTQLWGAHIPTHGGSDRMTWPGRQASKSVAEVHTDLSWPLLKGAGEPQIEGKSLDKIIIVNINPGLINP